MISSKLGTWTVLTALGLLTSLASIFIAFFEGPQIGHYINSCSLVLTIVLISVLIITLMKDGTDIIKVNRGLFTVLIAGLLVNVFIALTFINIRYGFSNWEYKNILTMEFTEDAEEN